MNDLAPDLADDRCGADSADAESWLSPHLLIRPLGPLEPLGSALCAHPSRANQLHLTVIGEPALDYPQLRRSLGGANWGLRVHSIPDAMGAVHWILDRRRDPVSFIALAPTLPGGNARELVGLLRARRELRAIPTFVCDSSYKLRRSKMLYAAGVNGYLCGASATRQLATALLNFQTLTPKSALHLD